MNFRNYKTKNNIRENYEKQRTYQTFNFTKYLNNKYNNFTTKLPFWDAMSLLDNFIDISDPDIELPNSYHLFQTAEAIRNDNLPDWLQLVGLIHDLGKIIYIKGCDYDGTSLREQWSIVGDTFITGCKLPETLVYPELNELNEDMKNPKYNSKLGIYHPHCGLDNCLLSYGHDEYMYQLLRYNDTKIPEEGLHIIRYHSLYVHHTNEEYEYLINEKDKEYKKWLKLFNKYDLYSKENTKLNIDKLKNYYDNLVIKYIGKYLYI